MPGLASLTLSTCNLFLLSNLMYSYLDDTQLHHSVYIYIFITHNIPPHTSHAYTSSQYSTKLLNLSLYICIFLLLRTPPKCVVFPPPGLELTVMGKTSTCKSPTYRTNTSRSILTMLTHTNRKYADIHIPFHTHHLAIR
jgi:hypothetical protein